MTNPSEAHSEGQRGVRDGARVLVMRNYTNVTAMD